MLAADGIRVTIGDTDLLRDASLRAAPGRVVAIVGPNGAGKSTLLRVVAGLLKPAAGTVTWGGRELSELRPRHLARLRAFVPQRGVVPPGVSVRDVVELGRAPHLGPLRRPTAADRAAVDSALARTATTDLADRRLTTLSGGELQRAQIAIALAQDAPALLADEPTSSLDLGASSAIARLLRALAHDHGMTVVLVVHDLALAAAVADDVVVVSEGRTVAAGPPDDVLTPDRLREVWHVDADIERGEHGRTALRVDWLGAAGVPAHSAAPTDR